MNIAEKLQTWVIDHSGELDLASLYTKILAADVVVSRFADGMFHSIRLRRHAIEQPVRLVAIETEALLGGEGSYGDLIAAAKDRGYSLCEAVDGLLLRQLHSDQPRGEWLQIAMQPIVVDSELPRVWDVGHSNKTLWLRTTVIAPEMTLRGGVWVFRSPID